MWDSLTKEEGIDEGGQMRETLGVLLGFFLAAVLGYLISEVAQKEQEKEVLESYMDSLQEIYEVIRQRMDVTRKFRHDLLSHVQTLEYLIEKPEKSGWGASKICGSADRNISENSERNLLPG